MSKELQLAPPVLLHALANTKDFPVSVGIHADRNQQGHLADLASPGPLQPDPVQVQVRVFTLDRMFLRASI